MIFQNNIGGYTARSRHLFIYIYTWDCRTPLDTSTFPEPHTPPPTNNPHLLFARPPFQNNILLYVVGMDEFDTKDVKSIVYVEPKTNNVVIKITGLPNELASMMYMDWIMSNLGFEYNPDNQYVTDTVH